MTGMGVLRQVYGLIFRFLSGRPFLSARQEAPSAVDIDPFHEQAPFLYGFQPAGSVCHHYSEYTET